MGSALVNRERRKGPAAVGAAGPFFVQKELPAHPLTRAWLLRCARGITTRPTKPPKAANGCPGTLYHDKRRLAPAALPLLCFAKEIMV